MWCLRRPGANFLDFYRVRRANDRYVSHKRVMARFYRETASVYWYGEKDPWVPVMTLSPAQRTLLKRLRLKENEWSQLSSQEEPSAEALKRKGLVRTRRGRLNLWLEAQFIRW